MLMRFELAKTKRDLGVVVKNSVTMSTQCEVGVKKANSMLEIIRIRMTIKWPIL